MEDAYSRKIVLHDACFQHLLITGAEVDESKVVCVGETDAGEARRCWNASSEQERALVVLPPRNVDGISQRPASLQHGLAYPSHQLTSLNCVRTRAMPGAPVQSHLGVVFLLRLIYYPETAVDIGFLPCSRLVVNGFSGRG